MNDVKDKFDMSEIKRKWKCYKVRGDNSVE